jgi:hypothetical protein
VHPLDSVRAKIRRGYLHVKALEQELERFLSKRKKPPGVSISAKVHPDKDYISLSVHRVEEVPLWIAVIAADAFHNFRSALDQLIFETALIDGGGSEPKKSAFPASQTIDNFRSSYVQDKMLKYLTVRHRILVRRFQPYRGWKYEGAHPITLLDDLWNDDKHRFTQPIFLCAEVISPNFPTVGRDCFVRGAASDGRVLGRPLRPGTEFMRIYIVQTGPKPHLDVKVTSTVFVGLRNGESVASVGRKVSRYIKEIVAAFEPEFERPKALKMKGVARPGNLSAEGRPVRTKMTVEGSDTPFE